MPKNISRSQKKGAAGSEQPLTLLDAVRQVGDEALKRALAKSQLPNPQQHPTEQKAAKRSLR